MRAGLVFSQFLIFIALFFGIWGPKIWGFFDLMVFVPAIVLLLMLTQFKIVSIQRRFFLVSVALGLVVIIWVGITFLLNSASDIQGLLRSVRAFISLIILVPLFYSLASRHILSPCSGFVLLVLVLFVNTLVVYAQIIFPPLQELMAPLWGFDKSINGAKAFGLTAGYDSAGYLAAFLAASAFAASFIFRSWGWFVFFVICAGAVGFTSRTSMLVLTGLTVVVFLLNKSDWKANSARIGFAVVGGVLSLAWYVLPRIISGVVELSSAITHEYGDYTSDYASTSLADVLERHAVLPQNVWTWLFGSGEIFLLSDIGYVKILFLGGVPLLAVMVAFYVYLYRAARVTVRFAYTASKGYWEEQKWAHLWGQVFLLMLLIMFVGNMKNLYFFARGYHEIFIIIGAMMMGFFRGGGLQLWCRSVGGATDRMGGA
jgi:hypothetical protein